ncbi:MAG TPA: hypothetical protein VJ901_17925 [Thermoanaerobaculia bacterium]|nr:hypothetical protein [Thermoanaerobaculia bacterium]
MDGARSKESTSTPSSVTDALERHGLLLVQDKSLTSVAGIITGESLATSWWSHPKAKIIFRTLDALESISLATRLVAKKVTLVHRRLWPELLAVANAEEAWQRRALSPTAKALLEHVEREDVTASGKDAHALQERLLAIAFERHTESGKHETILTTFARWAAREQVVAHDDLAAAKQVFEQAVAKIGGTARLLPWQG